MFHVIGACKGTSLIQFLNFIERITFESVSTGKLDGHAAATPNLLQYAIPKINMLCNLMLFENEVKAAVR